MASLSKGFGAKTHLCTTMTRFCHELSKLLIWCRWLLTIPEAEPGTDQLILLTHGVEEWMEKVRHHFSDRMDDDNHNLFRCWCGLMWVDVGWCGLMWVDVGWCGLMWVDVGWCGLMCSDTGQSCSYQCSSTTARVSGLVRLSRRVSPAYLQRLKWTCSFPLL